MKEIQSIRSGAYKEYLGSALIYWVIVGLLFFLINLVDTDFKTSIIRGFTTSFFIVGSLFTIGFIHQEWYLRKQKIILLASVRYSSLTSLGLALNNGLDYAGCVDEYFVRFMINEKWIEKKKKNEIFSSVDIYSNPLDFERLEQLIKELRAMPEVKTAAWGYGIFSIYFENEIEQIHEVLMQMIFILKESSVVPIEMRDWENSFGIDLRESLQTIESQQAKQLIKYGKIDLKYKRPGQKK